MKSSKRLFSKTVFWSDIKRFVPFAVPLLIAEIILFPVAILSYGYELPLSPLDWDNFAPYSTVSSGFAFVFAGVMALLVFSYLYSPNKCNALHAFPIGRRALFCTNFAAGYLLLVLPQLLGFLIAVPIIGGVSQNAGALVLLQLVSIFGESLIYYAVGVLAVMLAANLFAGGVIYLILSFVYSAASGMLNLAVERFGYGIYGVDYTAPALEYLSPVVCLFSRKSDIGYSSSWTNYHTTVQESVNAYYRAVLILVILAAVAVAVAYLLYKARSLECAGDMVPFKAEVPVLSVLVGVLGGAAMTALLSALFAVGVKVVQLVIYGIFSLLLFFAARMILKKSAKVFQLRAFLLWAVCCAVSIGGTLGLAHYTTQYIPPVDKVESMTVYISYDITLTDGAEIQKAEALHRLMLQDYLGDGETPEDPEPLPFYSDTKLLDTYGLMVTYELKDGRTLDRSYWLSEYQPEVMSLIDELEGIHRPITIFEQLEGVDFTVNRAYVDDYSGNDYQTVYLSKDEQEPFYSAVAAQAKADAADYRTYGTDRYQQAESEYSVTFVCKANTEEAAQQVLEAERSSYDVNNTYLIAEFSFENESDKTFQIEYEIPVDKEEPLLTDWLATLTARAE
ncbi:MAG: hypothetical protein IJ168_03345 [Eubacterium sp.]|nr:hypothetical protein [Eubacterium sp.]